MEIERKQNEEIRIDQKYEYMTKDEKYELMTVEEIFITEDVPIEIVMKKIEQVETNYGGLMEDKLAGLIVPEEEYDVVGEDT